jgi:hypothetical protein
LTYYKEMGRKTAAQLILEDLGDEEETEDMYLVSYDFIEDKSNPRFWSNLREVSSMTGGQMVQYSVYHGNRRGARAVRELAKRYGADVRWYAAIELR